MCSCYIYPDVMVSTTYIHTYTCTLCMHVNTSSAFRLWCSCLIHHALTCISLVQTNEQDRLVDEQQKLHAHRHVYVCADVALPSVFETACIRAYTHTSTHVYICMYVFSCISCSVPRCVTSTICTYIHTYIYIYIYMQVYRVQCAVHDQEQREAALLEGCDVGSHVLCSCIQRHAVRITCMCLVKNRTIYVYVCIVVLICKDEGLARTCVQKGLV